MDKRSLINLEQQGFIISNDLYIKGTKKPVSLSRLVIPEGIKGISSLGVCSDPNRPASKGANYFDCVVLPSTIRWYGFGNAEVKRVDITDLAAYCNNAGRSGVIKDPRDMQQETVYGTRQPVKTGSEEQKLIISINGQVAEHINIPAGVEHVQPFAFYGTAIRSVTVPQSVRSIGQGAFADCPMLETINWNAEECESTQGQVSVFKNSGSKWGLDLKPGAKVSAIPANVFAGTIREVKLPRGLKRIAADAFAQCKELKNVVWDAENCTIESNLNSNCFAAPETLVFGANVKKIPPYAFAGARSLGPVTLPEGLTSIGDYAFAFCKLGGAITIPNSVTEMGQRVFWGCGSAHSSSEKAATKAKFSGCNSSVARMLRRWEMSQVSHSAQNTGYKKLEITCHVQPGWDPNWAVGSKWLFGTKKQKVIDK